MTSLHVLGGSLKNRPLKSPKKARPTTAIMRKSLFDMIRPNLQGSSFLDLFAGSGAIGIEALSQGASLATFIDTDTSCVRENLHLYNLQATVFQGDVLSSLKRLKGPFHFVYCDPPYDLASLLLPILLFLDQSTLLAPHARLFFEEAHPPTLQPPPLSHLLYKETRRFGNSVLHQYFLPVK